jgi:hypothetical protein
MKKSAKGPSATELRKEKREEKEREEGRGKVEILHRLCVHFHLPSLILTKESYSRCSGGSKKLFRSSFLCL